LAHVAVTDCFTLESFYIYFVIIYGWRAVRLSVSNKNAACNFTQVSKFYLIDTRIGMLRCFLNDVRVCRMSCRILTYSMRNKILDSLKAILACNFEALNERVFRHRLMKFFWTENLSFSMKPFRVCLRRETIKQCLPLLTERCQRSRVVAIKVIRLDMSLVEEMLKEDPVLRVLYLVRDPRGIMESWKKVTVPKQTDMDMRLNAMLVCKRMLKDRITHQKLHPMLSKRIYILRYEDLVTETDLALDQVYKKLLQISTPMAVRQALNNQLGAKSDNGVMGTRRKNGTQTAYRWKHTITHQYHSYINETCRQVLLLFNYDTD